jgi:hypothetical protein
MALSKDAAVLDLAALPTRRLNIRANCEPQLVGAVRFTISGVDVSGNPLPLFVPPLTPNSRPSESFPSQIEFMYPYMLTGDPSLEGQPLPTHSNAWTPPAGRYTLTAVPYAIKKDEGARGEPLSVQFEVVDSAVGK